jgi:hypothetical protein
LFLDLFPKFYRSARESEQLIQVGDRVRIADRKLSRESGIGGPENADRRDSILRQLKEMLNGLQGKGFPQLNDPNLSPQRPSRNLHKLQGSSR